MYNTPGVSIVMQIAVNENSTLTLDVRTSKMLQKGDHLTYVFLACSVSDAHMLSPVPQSLLSTAHGK